MIEIAKNLLNENAIEFAVVDNRDSMSIVLDHKGIELYVQGDDVIKTKKILAQLETE